MIYLYWYLGIGVAVLVSFFGAHWLKRRRGSESLRDALDAMHRKIRNAVNPDYKKSSYQILNNFVAPGLAAVVVVVIWPVAAYMKLRTVFSKRNATVLERKREFAVERIHLQERLTVQEIEAREMVEDPLGAAPNVPFGHLNAAWRMFLGRRSKGKEIWSFTARWQETRWSWKELRSGYAMVHNGTPIDHFLTVRKALLEEDNPYRRGSGAG